MYAHENHATSGSHARVAPGSTIAINYEVVGEAGSGNFARVFECRDVRSGAKVAVKLMKHGFERDADYEQEILNSVTKNDPQGTSGIVRLLERVRWQGHAGLVFGLKGKSLRTARLPMAREQVSTVARDVASALDFLHFTCRAVHTDLKPENILGEINPTAQRSWSVCDFGSASFYNPSQLDNDLITTRPYRAPEVVLKRGWNYNADTWSLGCVLYELFTGRKLFDAQTDAEHLELIQARLGPLPASMHPPRSFMGRAHRVQPLKEELAREPAFLDLLLKLLQVDPHLRIRCGEVSKHAFVKGSEPAPAATEPMKPFASRLSTMTASAVNVPMGPKAEVHGLTAGATYRLLKRDAGLPHPSAFPQPSIVNGMGRTIMSPAMPTFGR